MTHDPRQSEFSRAVSGYGQRTSSQGLDHRRAPRYTVLIRSAKLINGSGEFLCVIRDVSETGLSVSLFHELPGKSEAILELPNGVRFRLLPVWSESGKAGFLFAAPIDRSRLVGNQSNFPRRPIRLTVRMDAFITLFGRSIGAEIRNISQQGAHIAVGERLALDQRLRLGGPALPDIRANVRWRKNAEYGLVFDDTFQLSELARIVARAQLGLIDR
jgi:hypothetical protein